MSVEFTVDADGWVAAARKLPSPNFEARPAGVVPTLVVVHNISLPPNQFGGTAIAELFLNTLDCNAHPYYDSHLRGVRVSAHFVILRDGTLEQFVSCNERAWHAGASNFFGRERCNDFSIGIELEGSDAAAFEAAQYRTLGALVSALTARYPVEAIAGHSDIAPGRKTDPGPHFEWPRLRDDTALSDQYFPYLKFSETR
ncbi:1,6-anhydro-N-acetylmuramyl-L-alanine amidase AmpD [Paraburkholderia metrosideri]|uniref:1,6-anhydro-N-acetylmuramyl-L-alanine amidase AmpD n=1 Tax=Paraburkholderia metrosideri TaxID=580937 RepID=A0ABN7IG41_9BURK|nr:1,6-anhydro-N-acetylmuramyl-L-alanine amidase AmpD [Paraburkholderia metrosideri]CAD6558940.1 1,6-anhydro-N-acetylmuramyl-L-alanine amidase AmpD [Paraburkholderia metrosideri]